MKKILLSTLISFNILGGKLNIKIILASARDNSPGLNIANEIKNNITDKDVNIEILDPSNFNLPFFNSKVSPAYAQEYDNENVKKWAHKINEADGFIILAPEYNHSFPALLKNALDVIYKEWNYKPVVFAGYSGGTSGGTRSIEQLRLISIELKMIPLRPEINIPQVWKALDSKCQFNDKEVYTQIKNAYSELKRIAQLFKEFRDNGK